MSSSTEMLASRVNDYHYTMRRARMTPDREERIERRAEALILRKKISELLKVIAAETGVAL